MDWTSRFAERARNRGGAELAAILSGPGPGVLAMTGGFPNVATFQTEVLGEIAARVIASDPGVALQYGPSAGLPATREYLRSRVATTQGVAPAEDELIVTSGGMECIDLLCRTLLEPGRRRRDRGADLPRRDPRLLRLPGVADRRARWTRRACSSTSSRRASRAGTGRSSST